MEQLQDPRLRRTPRHSPRPQLHRAGCLLLGRRALLHSADQRPRNHRAIRSGWSPHTLPHRPRQYQLGKRGPYIGFNWRFDSGQVAGAAPCYGTLASNDCLNTTDTAASQPTIYLKDATGVPLTADQEAQAGLACNGVSATLGHPLPATCLVSQFTSSLLKLPAPNAENDDHNPARIAPRNLFDLSFGEDNLLHRKSADKRTLSASLTIVNLTNKYALYNFLSTFSGTHFVSPRSLTAQLAYHF
jgi:hypothetical protein